MRSLLVMALLLPLTALRAQAAGKWPPDSLVNTKVFPRTTPVMDVVGAMRNVTAALGVRCSYCHVGTEGEPLERYDFPSDEKRPKLIARQMMRMVEEINHRLDTIPSRPAPAVEVTCRTCHRGVSRPVPLSTIIIDATLAAGADSGLRAYQALRERYYGRDAYDFGESALSIAAFRVSRQGRTDDGLRLLDANEQRFPGSSGLAVFRGNILLMRGDTTGAAAAFREAIRRDAGNGEARGRLRDIGQAP